MLSIAQRTGIVDWAAFGKWVALKQAELRISDRELARRSKISATHIGFIKRGMTALRHDRLTALIEALGSNESEARMALQIEKPELTDEERELLQTYRRVSEHDRSKFLGIAKAAGQAFSTTH